MAKNNNLTDFLTDIATTIRNTDGTATTPLTDANKINPQDFSTRIINYQNKTVTPSTSQQSITRDNGYMALGTVTVNAMPGGTATVQDKTSGGTAVGYGKEVSLTAGYYSAQKFYNSVGAVSGSIGLSNNTSGSATAGISNTDSMAEISSTSGKTAGTDYFRVKATATGTAGSVTPRYTVNTAGYIGSTVTGSATSVSVSSDTTGQTINVIKAAITNNTTLPSGSSSSGTINAGSYIKIEPGYNKNTLYYQAGYPTLSGDAIEANVLSGKTFYSNSYTKKTGSMTNNGSVTEYVGYGNSYTIPAGYHDGTGTVSNSDEPGTIDVTDLTITPNALSGTWDSTNNRYVVSQASKTATMQSTVTAAGYVSSTVGTKNTGTATVSAPSNLEIPKATFEVSGASVKTTSSGAGYIPASTTVGTIGSGSATGNAGTITYVSHTQDSSNKKKFTITGSVTAPAPTISSGYITTGTAGSTTNRTVSVTITDAQAQAAVGAGSVTISDSTLSVSPSVTPTALASATGNITLTASTTQPSGYYVKVTGGNSATTGSATSGESSTVTKTAGYIAAGTNTISSTATATANASSKDQYYSVPSATFKIDEADVMCDDEGYVFSNEVVYTIPSGSATTPTASGASTSTSLSGTTLTVSRSVTPTVVPGYISTGTAGTVTITGTVPTETKSATGSGDITPSSGKLLSKVTVGAGSATTPATSITANPGAVTWNNTDAVFKTSTYATKVVTPTVSAGWVSSGTGGNITVSGSTTVPTIEIGATLSGTLRVTPVIQNKTASISGKTQITASPSTSTSGISTYYMAVETPEDVHSIQAFSEVETAGYGDTSHYGSSSDIQMAGALESGTYYIPLASAAFTTNSNYVTTTSSGAGWVPANTVVGIVGSHTGNAASVSGTNTFSYSTNSTWSTSNTSSGIYASAYATGVSKRYTVSTAGWIIGGTYGGTDGTLSSSTYYLTGLTVASGKTLSSITNNGTLSDIINNGTISSITNNASIDYIQNTDPDGSIDIGNEGDMYIDNSGRITVGDNSNGGQIDIANQEYSFDIVSMQGNTVTLAEYGDGPTYHIVTNDDGMLMTYYGNLYATSSGSTTNCFSGTGYATSSGWVNSGSKTAYISSATLHGTASSLTLNSGTITNVKGTGTITTLGASGSSGILNITTNGYSSTYKGEINVTTNTNGKVRVGGTTDSGCNFYATGINITIPSGTTATVQTLTNSSTFGNGGIQNYTGTGTILTYTNTGTISNMTGSRTITNLGTSGATGYLTISNLGNSSSYISTLTVNENRYGRVTIRSGNLYNSSYPLYLYDRELISKSASATTSFHYLFVNTPKACHYVFSRKQYVYTTSSTRAVGTISTTGSPQYVADMSTTAQQYTTLCLMFNGYITSSQTLSLVFSSSTTYSSSSAYTQNITIPANCNGVLFRIIRRNSEYQDIYPTFFY